MDLPISKTIAVKDAGYDESWLEDMIWDNPSILGLGDLETVDKEQVVSSGGKLDILLLYRLRDKKNGTKRNY